MTWTSTLDARLRAGIDRGEPRATTAAALGVTVTKLQNRVRALGLCKSQNGTVRKVGLAYRAPGRDHDLGCRFYEGDPRTSGPCGDARRPGSPYCEDHHARCYDHSRSYRRL